MFATWDEKVILKKLNPPSQNAIRDGGSTATYTAYIACTAYSTYTAYTVYTAYTTYTAYTVYAAYTAYMAYTAYSAFTANSAFTASEKKGEENMDWIGVGNPEILS